MKRLGNIWFDIEVKENGADKESTLLDQAETPKQAQSIWKEMRNEWNVPIIVNVLLNNNRETLKLGQLMFN